MFFINNIADYRYLRTVSLFLIGSISLLVGSAPVELYAENRVQKIPFALDDDIAGIRAKIAVNGYDFKVSSNWVVKLPRDLREGMRARRYPASVVGRRLKERVLEPLDSLIDQPLPLNFDLRNVASGRSYIGPVRQQGSCGACYAFGACAAAEGAYNLATGSCDQNCVDFSEAFIAFCLDPLYNGFDGCRGSNYEYEELEALVEHGVCYEKQLPYNPASRRCESGLDVSTVHFTSWHRLPCNDTLSIKRAIHRFGVVDVAIVTNPAFDAYASGIYEDSETDCVDLYGSQCYYATTDHVAALVGWDDNGGDGYWILRNSWGSEWGESGYMRIKYHSAHVACAACYLVFTPKKPLVPQPKPEHVITPWLKLLLLN